MSDLITVNLSDLPLTYGVNPDRDFIENIRSLGVIEPIIITRVHDCYRIVDGNRRVAALRATGVTHAHIDAKVVDAKLADVITLSLNELRNENFATQTEAITRLAASGMDKTLIHAMTGMSKAKIERHLFYANTPTILFNAFAGGFIAPTVMDQVSRCTPAEQDQLALIFSGKRKITSTDVTTVREATRAPLRAEGGSNVVELITETERPYTLPELTADINRIADRAKAQGFAFEVLYRILVASDAYAIEQDQAAF